MLIEATEAAREVTGGVGWRRGAAGAATGWEDDGAAAGPLAEASFTSPVKMATS
jgi:hypothetical protein